MEPLAELAKRVVPLLKGAKRFQPNKWRAVRATDNPLLLLPSDAALVLGEAPVFGVSAFFASREEILPEGIYLLGNDLNQLGPHTSFARLVFIKLRNFFSYEKPNALNRLKAIRNLDGSLRMEGITINESPFEKQETILFKRDAFRRLSFEALGNSYLNLFKSNSDVEKVAVAFVTLPTFPYAKLQEESLEAQRVLDKILALGQMEVIACPVCSDKPFCEVIPGLKDSHAARVK